MSEFDTCLSQHMPSSHICILWFDVFANFEDLKKSELDTCLSRNMPFSLSATCALLESMFLRLLFKLKRPNWSFASAEMCIIIVWALFGFDAACNFCKKKECKNWHLPQPKYEKSGFHQICMLYLPLLLSKKKEKWYKNCNLHQPKTCFTKISQNFSPQPEGTTTNRKKTVLHNVASQKPPGITLPIV